MKIKYTIIAISAVYGICIWVLDAVLDYAADHQHNFSGFLFSESLTKEMFTEDLTSRVVTLVSIIGLGVLISYLTQRLTSSNLSILKSEEDLKKSNEILQKVVDGITDPLIMTDNLRGIIVLNKAAKEYFGVNNLPECVGRRCFEVLRGKNAPCEDCKLPFPFSGNQPLAFERKGLDGANRVEEVVVYPVSSETGGMEGTIIRISDVTQAKLFAKKVLQSEKLASLGLLVSGVAHEINNPNTFISFNIPILRDYLNEVLPIVDKYALDRPDYTVSNIPYGEFRDDIFRLLDNMEHGSTRINTIVSTLREFVRKRESSELSQVDLRLVVERAVAMCMGEIKKRIKHFKVTIPDGTPTFVSDSAAIEQVIVNLLINAIQASDKPDSSIELTVTSEDSMEGAHVIEVKDNGCGMDEKLKNKIFDPFFTTKTSPSGTGLGLYVSYNLVEGLGGSIKVESEPGKGSTFRVTLNGKNDAEESPKSAFRTSLSGHSDHYEDWGANGPKIRAKVVEDEGTSTVNSDKGFQERAVNAGGADIA